MAALQPENPKRKNDKAQIDATGRWVLVATISASSMAFFMQSALNIAIPTIQTDLGASGADAIWIVNVYQLVLSALLLVGGSLGDHYGRKRVYSIGIGIFVVASIACGFAPTSEILIAARAVQGIGGAMMVPGSLAIISAYFDSGTRGRAIGLWSAIVTAASALAPVLGGVLADIGLWRLILFVVAPFGLASLWALIQHVPESRDEEAPPQLDYLGGVLIILALGGIVFGATEIGRTSNFTDPTSLIAIIVGFVALGLFIVVEQRSDHPLVSLKLFQSRTFTGVNLQTLILYGALAGAITFLPWNLQQIQGYSATVAGFAGLPISILLTIMSGWAGSLVDRVGPRPPLIIGPTIVGFGFAALAIPGVTTGPSQYFVTFLPGILLIGFGMGVTVAPLTTTALGSVPQHNSGVASAINNLMSRASGSLAVALMGGLMLGSFTTMVMDFSVEANLPPEAEQTLIVNSQDLGNTQVPANLSESQTATVENAINWAFVQTFRIIVLITAVLCWLSALVAAWLIEPELAPPPELLKEAASD